MSFVLELVPFKPAPLTVRTVQTIGESRGARLMGRIQAAVRPQESVPVFLIYGRAALPFVLIYKREAWAERVPDRNIKTH